MAVEIDKRFHFGGPVDIWEKCKEALQPFKDMPELYYTVLLVLAVLANGTRQATDFQGAWVVQGSNEGLPEGGRKITIEITPAKNAQTPQTR